jgi:hypothetical protein
LMRSDSESRERERERERRDVIMISKNGWQRLERRSHWLIDCRSRLSLSLQIDQIRGETCSRWRACRVTMNECGRGKTASQNIMSNVYNEYTNCKSRDAFNDVTSHWRKDICLFFCRNWHQLLHRTVGSLSPLFSVCFSFAISCHLYHHLLPFHLNKLTQLLYWISFLSTLSLSSRSLTVVEGYEMREKQFRRTRTVSS